MRKLTSLFGILTSLVGSVGVAYAQSSGSPINSKEEIIKFFQNFLTWLAGLFWILAILSAFYAAFLYLGAGGQEKNVEKAHKQILYTIIAIIIGLIAFGLPAIINSFLKL